MCLLPLVVQQKLSNIRETQVTKVKVKKNKTQICYKLPAAA
jgi:hypothetical protein